MSHCWGPEGQEEHCREGAPTALPPTLAYCSTLSHSLLTMMGKSFFLNSLLLSGMCPVPGSLAGIDRIYHCAHLQMVSTMVITVCLSPESPRAYLEPSSKNTVACPLAPLSSLSSTNLFYLRQDLILLIPLPQFLSTEMTDMHHHASLFL